MMSTEIVRFPEATQLVTNALQVTKEQMDDFRVKCQNFTELSEQKPKKTKKHSMGFHYVDVDEIENRLNELFFGIWSWKIDGDPVIVANEIIVHGTLSVFHPVAMTWIHRSGIGATQIRFEKDSNIGDITKKIKTALQMDAPKASAEAFKNAAQTLGRVFGRGVRRKETENYNPLIKKVNQ
jgi:hypothetical protein